MRALLSVYDKTGIVKLARELVDLDFELVSTGGTFEVLHAAGLPVTSVSDVTGFPEILDGRVKTLHPRIHGGLLARLEKSDDLAALHAQEITPIGLLVCNLYPFEATVADPGVAYEDAIEQIDIGGPAMIRAAAKNHRHVLVLTSPRDYSEAIELLRSGEIDQATRRRCSARAFAHVSAYDAVVAQFLAVDELFPDVLTFGGRKCLDLRYGENPQQRAAAYRRITAGPRRHGVLDAEHLGGKELSYNNVLDADAAWGSIARLDRPTVAIVKHTIPCGLATRPVLVEAFNAALTGDPVSAYGGIVALNREVDESTAAAICATFFEVVIAPEYSSEARVLLQRKKKLRLIRLAGDLDANEPTHRTALGVRPIAGGFLVQERDDATDDPAMWHVVSKRSPTEAESRDLAFAWQAVRHVKSNAIVLAKSEAIIGVGAGQPNRLESVRLAVAKAGDRAAGSCLASDAFFPFADGLSAATDAGVSAVIQPGGSVRDDEVIAAADQADAVMIFTGRRHFLH